MANSKSILVIHATDADQHLGSLKEILEALKAENRIETYATLESESFTKNSVNNNSGEDGVIVLLSNDIGTQQEVIEETLLKFKEKHPQSKIMEIIVDNIPYELQLLAFPQDLEPIRARADMDTVWSEIGNSLRDMFPGDLKNGKIPWVKYLSYAAGVAFLAGLVYWVIGSNLFGSNPKADFSYSVLDPVSADLLDDAEACYLPCKVKFYDKSEGTKELMWDLQDTIIENEKTPVHVYLNPQKYKMILTAMNGNKKDTISKVLNVKSPPFASFDVINEGCKAPCEIRFENTSLNAITYNWEFTGTIPNTSDQKDPGSRTFNSDGDFLIRLEVEDDGGVKSEYSKTIRISKDDSPFAAFKPILISGKFGSSKKVYKFQDESKNAVKYRWEINKEDDASQKFTYVTPNIEHEFNGYGKYSVKLTVTNANGTNASDALETIVLSGFRVYPVDLNYEKKINEKNILKTVRKPVLIDNQ